MHNIHFDYAKTEQYQREEGMRMAQANGSAFEPKLRRHHRWLWGKRTKDTATRRPEIARAN